MRKLLGSSDLMGEATCSVTASGSESLSVPAPDDIIRLMIHHTDKPSRGLFGLIASLNWLLSDHLGGCSSSTFSKVVMKSNG